jgi:hypothetical protein
VIDAEALDTMSHSLFLVGAEVSADAPQSGTQRAALKPGTLTSRTIAPQ